MSFSLLYLDIIQASESATAENPSSEEHTSLPPSTIPSGNCFEIILAKKKYVFPVTLPTLLKSSYPKIVFGNMEKFMLFQVVLLWKL